MKTARRSFLYSALGGFAVKAQKPWNLYEAVVCERDRRGEIESFAGWHRGTHTVDQIYGYIDFIYSDGIATVKATGPSCPSNGVVWQEQRDGTLKRSEATLLGNFPCIRVFNGERV